mmetsp:Transcript_30115/g.82293  ORF Transcript_30115/g.82293 Transcript_30115/m.82293 type:complete len:218 (-) Transcript_30115:1123-1776(-)
MFIIISSVICCSPITQFNIATEQQHTRAQQTGRTSKEDVGTSSKHHRQRGVLVLDILLLIPEKADHGRVNGSCTVRTIDGYAVQIHWAGIGRRYREVLHLQSAEQAHAHGDAHDYPRSTRISTSLLPHCPRTARVAHVKMYSAHAMRGTAADSATKKLARSSNSKRQRGATSRPAAGEADGGRVLRNDEPPGPHGIHGRATRGKKARFGLLGAAASE